MFHGSSIAGQALGASLSAVRHCDCPAMRAFRSYATVTLSVNPNRGRTSSGLQVATVPNDFKKLVHESNLRKLHMARSFLNFLPSWFNGRCSP